jgi:glutamyl-tRNA synthetase
VVVDDRLMGVTHVIRAEEWIVSTPKHVLLYQALGWDVPQFYHMPLIRNPDRSKLSKRKNPTNVLWYRQEGFLPEAVVNYLALLGHSMPDQREVFTLEEFRREFSWERVTTTGPVFDMDKFEWLNGMWIRRLTVEELAARLKAEGFVPAGFPEDRLAGAVRLMQERLKRLKEFADGAAFFAARLPYEAALLVPDKKGKPLFTANETRAALARLKEMLVSAAEWKTAPLEAAGRALADELQWKPGELFTVLRVAITGRRVSTPLFETMEILGREECLGRMDEAINKIADCGLRIAD